MVPKMASLITRSLESPNEASEDDDILLTYPNIIKMSTMSNSIIIPIVPCTTPSNMVSSVASVIVSLTLFLRRMLGYTNHNIPRH